MSTREANIALLSAIPESRQQEVYAYLSDNFFKDNPFKPLSADEISMELAEARKCAELGEIEDFDDALDEISKKYGL